MTKRVEDSFWNEKRVFITGHTGFKGSWLSLWLTSLGAKVTGYSVDTPTSPSLFEAANVQSLLTSIAGDIRDLEHLVNTMKAAKPDIVLHLAAQSLVRKSYQEPVDTFDVNMMGTVKVLEAIRSVDSVRSAVIVSSDKCYENNEWHRGYRESDPMGGHDPYSASKGCTELIANSYLRSYFTGSNSHGCAIATARAGNVIGGGDWAEDRLVPDILSNLASDKSIEIRNPNAIRPWQHVLEPLSGYMLLAQHLFEHGETFSGGWNFGPNETGSKTVSWIADEMVQQWGSGSWFVSEKPSPHEATFLKLDSTKAGDELNWSAVWSPKEALKATIRWHQSWLAGHDMAVETIKDIDRFVIDKSHL